MIGIVLISHGNMANGMLESAHMFFGSDIPQVATICFTLEDSPESFDSQLKSAVQEVDSGNGVIIMADLFGGTPCNRAAYCSADNIIVLSGMNLPMLMELLGKRLSADSISDIDISGLVDVSRNGIRCVNEFMKNRHS